MKNQFPELNRIGEFRDKEAENKYFLFSLERNKGMLYFYLLFVPLSHVLMLALNYWVRESTKDFMVNLYMRSIIIILSLLLFAFSIHTSNLRRLNHFTILFSVFLVIHYQILVIINGNNTFYQQAMSFYLLIIAMFMIPMRWIYCLAISIGTTLSFFICFYVFFNCEPLYQYARYVVYFSLGNFSAGYFSYHLQLYRREQYARENNLVMLSYTDGLTQLYNRQFFDDMLAHWIWKGESGGVFSLIMFDLDNFKKINDTYGHAVGDVVLTEVAKLVKSYLRDKDIFARWGGEEFMILLPEAEDKDAMGIAQRLCREVEEYFRKEYKVTASFGITMYQGEDTSVTMVTRADQNMYQAKKQGKNQVVGDK